MKCPYCRKEIIAKDLQKSNNKSGKVLKVRMVFFAGNETIKGTCGRCKRVIDIPYKLVPAGP